MRRKGSVVLLILIAVILVSLFAGNDAIGTADILRVLAGSGKAGHRVILFQVRLPRIAAAAGCGAALSVAGFLLQTSLDNRIASPGILGINNGAGLFVLLSALLFPFRSGMRCVMAFAGALAVTALISMIAVRTGISRTSVILSGVAVSALCVSAIDMIISLRPETVADRAAFQIGGFAALNGRIVPFGLLFIAAGLIAAYLLAPFMDLLCLGDETAQGLGLDVRSCRYLSIACAALLAGASISMGGLLGFVGLIVPNCVRMAERGRCRNGVILCALCGAVFLLACDTLSRLLVFPYELPCGLLLSLIGAPFLTGLLVKKRKRMGAG